jgi:hypothetical protein
LGERIRNPHLLGGRERRGALNGGYHFVHHIRMQIAFDSTYVSGQLGDDLCRWQA